MSSEIYKEMKSRLEKSREKQVKVLREIRETIAKYSNDPCEPIDDLSRVNDLHRENKQ